MTSTAALTRLSCHNQTMIILGIILLILGYFLVVPVLETLGIILLIIGAVLWILGAAGRPIAGRKYWY